MGDEATALAKAAHDLYDAARVHKRSEFAHRRQARALMQTFDEIKRVAEAHGIKVTITEAKGDPHGQRERARPGPRS